METIIKIRPEEFTSKLLENIQKLLKGRKNAEMTISIQDKTSKKYLRDETREAYFARLNESIKQLEKGNVITFSAESFNEFSRERFGISNF
jgi:beta-galactosidase beta subunit